MEGGRLSAVQLQRDEWSRVSHEEVTMARLQSFPSVQFMQSMNLEFLNTLKSHMVESATACSTSPPKHCTLESPSVSLHYLPFTTLAITLYC